MQAWKHSSVIATLLLVSITLRAVDLGSFDSIVTAQLVHSAFSKKIELRFQSREDDGERVYQAEYPFRRSKSGQHYLSIISVAKAGKYLSWEEHRRRVTETQKQYHDREAAFFRREFPAIGRFAQRESLLAGPDGASYGLSFRTTDDLYDVRLVVSSLLPSDVSDPGLNLEQLAAAISSRYDEESKKRQRKNSP